MKRLAIYALVALFSNIVFGITWTTIDSPWGNRTQIMAIDGSNCVGYYSHGGCEYNGISWSSFYYAPYNYIYGVDGDNIVGWYANYDGYQHGFVYNKGTWITVDYPSEKITQIYAISGSTLVAVTGDYPFKRTVLYDLSSHVWTNIPIVGGDFDIDGSNIVGGRQLYNMTTHTLTNLNVPGYVYGIDGSNIVGGYEDSSFNYHGYIYNLSSNTWSTLDFPGGRKTIINGIDGDKIVGYYTDASGYEHGFIATIPEPATLLLLGLGAVMLRKRK